MNDCMLPGLDKYMMDGLTEGKRSLRSSNLLVLPEERAVTGGGTCGCKILIALHVFKRKVISGCVSGGEH